MSYAWIVETLVASTLLIAAVLILRRPAARLLGPQAAYLLWALPALRLLLPPIPGASIVDVPLIEAPVFPVSGAQAIDAAPALQVAASAPTVDWALAPLVVWLSVAAIYMICQIVSYRQFIGRAVASQARVHSLDGILVYGADVAGPAAAGILHRRIFLPYDFSDRFDASERRLALAHEIAHHRRGDLIANWIALAVLSLHWFNPLAHIAYRAFRADQELACDATVLAAASASERHAYASALVKAAWRKSPVAACPMNSAGQLKARLAMMKLGAWSLPRRLTGLAVVLMTAVSALGVTASRTAAALPEAGSARSPVAETGLRATATFSGPTHLAGETSTEAVPASGPAPIEGSATIKAATAQIVLEDATPVVAAPAVQIATLTEDLVQPIALVHVTQPTQAASPPPAIVQVSAPQTTSAAFPSARELNGEVAAARKQLASLPAVTEFREVRAVMVDGRFNAANPGQPYVGFCGQLRVRSNGYGYRQTDWLPFFVSTTPSKTHGRAEKCAGARSSEDYARDFAQPFAQRRVRSRSYVGGCNASLVSCAPGYYARYLATQSAVDTERLVSSMR